MSDYKSSGFMAYWLHECFLKYLDGDLKYQNFNELPYYHFFKKQWNTRVHKYRQSKYFQILEKKLPLDTDNFLRCYAYYWLRSNGKNFHAKDIIENDLKVYNYHEYIINTGLKNTFINDLHIIFKYSKKHKIKITKMFNKDIGIPEIYSLYFKHKISIYTILIYHNILKFGINIDPLNIVDNNKMQYIINIFSKFHPLVEPFLEKENWKELILLEMKKFK